MRIPALLLLAASALQAQFAFIPGPAPHAVIGGGSPFYSRSITVDHTKVPNTNQTNFAVAVVGTYAYLKTIGNGGKVSSSSGYDVVFGTDNLCSSRLDWETVNWGASTGTVEYWVRVPTLTTASDYVFYVCYGDATITTNQSNKTGTWNSAYKMVQHLPDGTTLSLTDSTSNTNNGTNHGATAVAGQIDGALDLSGGATASVADASNLNITGNITVSSWVKYTGSQNGLPIIAKWNVDTSYLLTTSFLNASRLLFSIRVSGVSKVAESSSTYSDNTWHLVEGVFDGSNVLLYIDGALVTTGDATSGPIDTSVGTDLIFGNYAVAGGGFTGSIDESRISNTNRSADWIATEYNNQSSPSTFYAVGSEVMH